MYVNTCRINLRTTYEFPLFALFTVFIAIEIYKDLLMYQEHIFTSEHFIECFSANKETLYNFSFNLIHNI
jgi:hypothetical protein